MTQAECNQRSLLHDFRDHAAYRHSIAKLSASWDLFACSSPKIAPRGQVKCRLKFVHINPKNGILWLLFASIPTAWTHRLSRSPLFLRGGMNPMVGRCFDLVWPQMPTVFKVIAVLAKSENLQKALPLELDYRRVRSIKCHLETSCHDHRVLFLLEETHCIRGIPKEGCSEVSRMPSSPGVCGSWTQALPWPAPALFEADATARCNAEAVDVSRNHGAMQISSDFIAALWMNKWTLANSLGFMDGLKSW